MASKEGVKELIKVLQENEFESIAFTGNTDTNTLRIVLGDPNSIVGMLEILKSVILRSKVEELRPQENNNESE